MLLKKKGFWDRAGWRRSGKIAGFYPFFVDLQLILRGGPVACFSKFVLIFLVLPVGDERFLCWKMFPIWFLNNLLSGMLLKINNKVAGGTIFRQCT